MSKYDTLNDMQQMAVYHTDGPLLVLAGAGSGKTRVLTHRIAYLIEEKGANPWNILAITFTNKAAGEMRERVNNIVGFGAESIWVSTFHSTCVRILRRHIDRIGYDTNFTIYDADDQKTVMRAIVKKLGLDPKMYKEKAILNAVSHAKDELISPDEFAKSASGNYREMKFADAYYEYQSALKKSNALDFDDLIVKTVELFKECPEVLEYYQERFKYIMVDEYQDTNTAQFMLVKLLADKYRNICVVGDDDQSIYKFRGANIANILQFENAFENARVIKLEQNYRSTRNILDAANAIVHNNMGRKDKTLWCDNDEGKKIDFYQTEDAYREAELVVSAIEKAVSSGDFKYNDCACLYRTNAQSRLLEEKLLLANIPYKIVGGQNFYQRKEIKDVLAYLKTIDNGMDDVAVKRIINVPRRGIGATTISKIQLFADMNDLTFYDAMRTRENLDALGKTAAKITSFIALIEEMKVMSQEYSIKELTDMILEQTGYKAELVAEGTDEAKDRIENIDELINKMADYDERAEEPSLSEFLEEVALVAEIDSLDENSDYVVLMTIHSAKGLEFPKVFLCGMEDGLFPSYMNIISDDPDELEEERRLCYVAITRAMQELTISWAQKRMIHGETRYNVPSRFIQEIPPLLLERSESDRSNERKNDRTNTFGSSAYGSGIGASKPFGSSFNKPYAKSNSISANKSTNPLKNGSSFGSPSTKPAFGKEFNVTKDEGVNYSAGDRVKHIKFGEGTVISLVDGGRDFEVTVNFDKTGIKKMFASFAKLKKL